MSEKTISDLRRRMLEDMAVRQFGEKTKHDYIRIENPAGALQLSPAFRLELRRAIMLKF